MDRIFVFLAGAGLGAVAGRWLNRTPASASTIPVGFSSHEAYPVDILARTHFVLKEIRALVVHARIPDEVLEAKLKAKVARMIARPDAVQVRVRQGKVLLQGTARAEEILNLAEDISGLRGVKELENRLEAMTPPFTSWEDAEPGSRHPKRNIGSYPPPVSLVLAAAGATLTYAGYRIRGGSGVLMVAAGAALIGAGAGGLFGPGAFPRSLGSHISESASWRPGFMDSKSAASP